MNAGSFSLFEFLGAGGSAVVYAARHREVAGAFAVKLQRVRSREAFAAFEREAHAMASIAHPGVLDLLDVGQRDHPSRLEAVKRAAGRWPVGAPTSWPQDAAPMRTPRARGLGVLGLRPPMLVGRFAERTALWRALLQVHETRRGLVLRLGGEAGAAQQALARWLCETAAQVGAALWLRLPADAGDETLVLALRDALHGHALDPAALGARAAAFGWSVGVGADGAPLVPAMDGTRGVDADALRRWLREQSRPVILWVPTGISPVISNTLAAAVHAQDATCLMLWEPHEHDAQLGETLVVPPVDPQTRREALRSELPLTERLAWLLDDDAAGDAVSAHIALRTLASDGLLVSTPDGFDLIAGAPTGPLAVEALAEHHAAELLAVLGVVVHDDRWRAACAAADLPPDPVALEHLSKRGALEETDGRYRFTAPSVRSALIERARRDGRLGRWHRAAAVATEADACRAAQHWLEADAPERALALVLPWLRERLNAAQPHGALAGARLATAALDAVGAGPEDPRRGLVYVVTAQAWLIVGDHAGSDRALDLIVRHSDAPGWLEARQHGFRLRAATLAQRGRFDEALPVQARVLADARLTGDPELLARAAGSHAQLLLLTGRAHAALVAAEEAVAATQAGGLAALQAPVHAIYGETLTACGRFTDACDAYAVSLAAGAVGGARARALKGLGEVYLHLGEPARSREVLDEARAAYAALNNPAGLQATLVALAEVARSDGQLDEAEALYREAARSFGGRELDRPTLDANLGLLAIARGRLDEAAEAFARAERGFLDQGRAAWAARIRLVALPAHLGAADLEARLVRAVADLATLDGPDREVYAALVRAAAQPTPFTARLVALRDAYEARHGSPGGGQRA